MTEISEGFSNLQTGIETSRNKILSLIKDVEDITYIYPGGNIGDNLIWEGTKQLLKNIKYKHVHAIHLDKNVKGHTALISGCGGWSKSYHHRMPNYLSVIENQFERVIILPSSFEPSVNIVKDALSKTKALVFSRELESYRLIKDLCNADFAYDCAFFFDFSPYKLPGKGVLNAYRTDKERAFDDRPVNNNDISLTCKNLSQWLKTIAQYDTIKTDRAHVMIASAMLGKTVYYRSSNYHKLPAIAEFSLHSFPVFREQA